MSIENSSMLRESQLGRRSIEELAYRLRDKYDKDCENSKLDIEYLEVVKYFGGKFKALDGKDGAQANIKVKANKQFTIQVREDNERNMTRNTIHELAHYILHSKSGEYVGVANQGGIPEKMEMEIEANQFLAAFLIPKKYIEKCINKDIFEIAGMFNVPIDVVEYRYQNV